MAITGRKASIPFDQIPILATLTAEDQLAIGPLCRMRDYEKGGVIFREGDPADRFYFIHTGRVKIVKSAGDRDIIIELLGAGEPVGVVAAFQQRAFPATAVALEAVSLISFPEREFSQLLDSRPEITRGLLAGLTLRLMMVNQRLAAMTGSAEIRAARLFLTLAARIGHSRSDGVFIPMPLSRQEIADLLGTTLETAIRLMSRWQKEKLLLTKKTGFVIPRLDSLQEICRTD
ncbi:MAG: Crp/Fnr family transcriptional regulator [Acidobacteriota bacterium]